MACFNIQITGGIDWASLPAYLDTDEQTTPALQSSDIDVYKGEYVDELVYDLSFPNTSKNYQILNSLLSGQSLNSKPKEVDVTAIYNLETMPQNKMRASKNGFQQDGRFYVVLYNNDNFAKKAKGLLLREIDFEGAGDCTQILPEIYAKNLQGTSYVDGGSILRFPWVSTSKKHNKDYAFTADLHLPFVYLWPVLKKGFAQIGIVFKCPFLESPYGRRILAYLLDDNMNNLFGKAGDIIPGKLDYPILTLPGPVDAKILEVRKDKVWAASPVPLKDNEGRYYLRENLFMESPTRGFKKNGVYTLEWKAKFQPLIAQGNALPWQTPPTDDILEIFVMCGEDVVHNEEIFINWEAPSTNNFEINMLIQGVCVNELRNLTIRYRCSKAYDIGKRYDLSIAMFEDSISLTVEKALIPAGGTYSVNQLFQGKDNLYDLFIGFAQTIFGKVHVHYSGRIMYLYTPFDVKIHSAEDPIEGYYSPTGEPLERIQENSHYVSAPDAELKRYIGVGWKASSDTYIESISNKSEQNDNDLKKKYRAELFSVYVDFGETYTPGRDDFDNKYFEPTAAMEMPVGTPYPYGLNIAGQGYRKVGLAPALIGTDDWELNNVGRRLLYSYGYSNFYRRDETSPSATAMYSSPVVKGGLLQRVFMALQSYEDIIHKIPATWENDRIFDLKYNDTFLPTSGEVILPNLYNVIARRFLISLRNFNLITVNAFLKSIDYGKINFRKQKYYSVKDHVVMGYIKTIADYTPCTPSNPAQLEILVFDPYINKPNTVIEYEENSFSPPPEVFDFDIIKTGCTYSAVPTGTSQL